MAEPELRVKLSAEGQAEVVAALNQVLNKAKEVGRTQSAGGGIGGIVASFGRLRALAAPLAGALAGVSFLGIITGAANASQRLLNAEQVMGTTQERARSLGIVAEQTGTSLGAISSSIARFAKTTTDALRGDPAALGLFRAIGMTNKEIQSFKGADTVQRIEIVGRAFGRLKDGPEKVAAEVALLKRGMQDLVPVINQIGREGLPKLGFVADEKALQSARSIGDQLTVMKAQIQELAIQFTAGLAPELTASLQAITTELGKSGSAAQEWGDLFGKAILAAVSFSVTALDTLLTELRVIHFELDHDIAALKVKGSGLFGLPGKESNAELKRLNDEREAGVKALYEESAARRAAFIEELKKLLPKHGMIRLGLDGDFGEGVGPAGKAPPDEEAAQRARDLQKANVDAQLRITQAGLKLQEALNERAFSDGLISLQAYYQKRREIAIAGVNAEINAAGAKRAAVQADPTVKNKPAELAKIDADIAVLVAHRSELISQSTQKETEATRQLGKEQIGIEKQILEAKGLTHEAALLQIEEQLYQNSLVLAQSKLSKDQQAAILAELERSLTAQADFNALQVNAGRNLTDFERDRSRIQDQIDAGLLSQAEGQARILDLQQQRIDSLRAIGQTLAESAKTPEQVSQAQDYLRSVDQIEIALRKVNDVGAQVKATTINALGDSLVRTFGEGELAAISWASVTKAVLLDVANALRRFTTQLLITKALMAIFGGGSQAIGGGVGAGGGGTRPLSLPGPVPSFAGGGLFRGAPNPMGTVSVPRFAAGGVFRGAGTATSDSNLVRVSSPEYFMPGSRLREQGMVQHLEALRLGTIKPYGTEALPAIPPAPAGTARGDAAPTRIQMELDVHPDAVVRGIRTTGGRDAIIEVNAKNARAVKGALRLPNA